MKIAVVLDQIAKGGTAKLAIEEVRELSRMGHDAQLLVLFDNKEGNFTELLAGISVRNIWGELPRLLRVNFRMPFFSFFSFFHLSQMLILSFVIKRREYDLFLSHLSYTCLSVYLASRVKAVPYIAYIHDSVSYIFRKAYLKGGLKPLYLLLYPFALLLDKVILKGAFAVCKQSRFEVDYLKRVSGKKVFVVPPSTYRRKKTIPPKRGDNLVAFTKWDFSKNFQFLIELMKGLPGQRLLVAGQWHPESYADSIREKIQQEGLQERITILGRLSEDGIKDLFDNARVLIHPLFEAWGSSLYEAACNGLTFVAPVGCGISEYLAHGSAAFYARQGDTEGFLFYINKLIDDGALALKMGRQAWKTIEKIDIENHAKMLVSIMESGK